MTIEAPRTLPAGWYTDPTRRDAKRWWDGTKWTEHQRVTAAPPVIRTETKSLSNPWGLQGVVIEPRAPLSDEEADAPLVAASSKSHAKSNAAWISLLFGLVAVGLTLLTSLPVSQTVWVIGAALISLAFGIRAVQLHRSGDAHNAWAPVLGILLSVTAAALMLLSVNVAGLVTSISSISPTQSSSIGALAVAPKASAVPLVFANNPELTADETATQTLATAINREFANGAASLQSGQAWPSALAMNGSNVVLPTGATVATLPAGTVATYSLSADSTSYHIAVHASNAAELATYTSGTNAFSWSCLADDASCTPSN